MAPTVDSRLVITSQNPYEFYLVVPNGPYLGQSFLFGPYLTHSIIWSSLIFQSIGPFCLKLVCPHVSKSNVSTIININNIILL